MSKNTKPTDAELLRKERTNLISFLRQRIQHASVICSRKARNITVGEDRRAIYALTNDSAPASHEMIYNMGEELGYRKVTKEEYKSIKKNAKGSKTKELVDENGFAVIEIEILNDGIAEHDYRGIFLTNKTDCYHNSPEEFAIISEEEREIEIMMNKLNSLDITNRKSRLKKFIKEHRGDKRYKEEISTARKLLKAL